MTHSTYKRQQIDSLCLVLTRYFLHTAGTFYRPSRRFTVRNFLFVIISMMMAGAAAAQNSAAMAQSSEGAQQLMDAAYQALAEHWHDEPGRVSIEISTLDPRVQVPVCSAPLHTSLGASGRSQGGRVTVRVECQGDAPWARHVAAQVRLYRPVVVSAQALVRGTVLSATDVTLEEREVSLLRGQWVENSEQVTGQALRRALPTGTPLTLDMLKAPILVKRGETVVLSATRAGISIRQTGVALQDGESGQQIPVRNERSGRVVQAVVSGPGTVEVIF